MIILLHSSKTMRASPVTGLRQPQLLDKAKQLDAVLKTLTPKQLTQAMHISKPLADKTHALIAAWQAQPDQQTLALDSFLGDIYSGLRASELLPADRDYADQSLRILSGLYGIIRPYDGICPYRLEMGYKLPRAPFASLYAFWGKAIADCLPKAGVIVNAASEEYSRTVTPFAEPSRLITPKFLTIDPQTGEPAFVVVHSKIARGAFARWLIVSRVTDPGQFSGFSDLGYRFDGKVSTPATPTFVCQIFEGKGLSMRTAR